MAIAAIVLFRRDQDRGLPPCFDHIHRIGNSCGHTTGHSCTSHNRREGQCIIFRRRRGRGVERVIAKSALTPTRHRHPLPCHLLELLIRRKIYHRVWSDWWVMQDQETGSKKMRTEKRRNRVRLQVQLLLVSLSLGPNCSAPSWQHCQTKR